MLFEEKLVFCSGKEVIPSFAGKVSEGYIRIRWREDGDCDKFEGKELLLMTFEMRAPSAPAAQSVDSRVAGRHRQGVGDATSLRTSE